MNERIEKSLFDILQMIDEIDGYFADGERKYANFVGDVRTRRAVRYNIAIIGEAVNRILKVEPDFPITHARKIVNTRNYVIHGYDSLTDDMLWGIVINPLPPLRAEVERLLAV